MRVRNDVTYIDGGSHFGYLTGWQDRLGLQIHGKRAATSLRIGYEIELNDRRDDATPTKFFSYSPTWNRFYGDATYYVSDAFDLTLRVDYQFSRYRDKNWDVFGEYTYANNSSKFSEYQYNDN